VCLVKCCRHVYGTCLTAAAGTTLQAPLCSLALHRVATPYTSCASTNRESALQLIAAVALQRQSGWQW
jgi:hypothetical protein